MATTIEPAVPGEAPTQGALDRAEGVQLLGDVDGSGYRQGAALVRRADGQMVQLGPLMYALLEEIDGKRSNGELASALCERLDRACDEEHVVALAQKLAAQGLLKGSEANAPERVNPLLALRWKVLVSNPKATRRLTMPFTALFHPFLLWPVVAAFVGVCWFVLFHKGIGSATAEAFQKPELLLLVFALAVASAGFHELGHAAACRYGGATPGGMGMGIYMVWPAFYTDVTDAYRLPRADRLRVDLGGIYFNAVIAVATVGVWLLCHKDALLLLVALQLLMMVKNLSPVFRSDGYHILADATGVPDLYAHLGPTLRRLLPWRDNEPSALKGRARALVTAWVLIVVPVLLSLMLGAVLVLPRVLASTWESGGHILSGIPHEASHGQILALLASLLRLVALTLPLLGSILIVQKLGRMIGGKALGWAGDEPVRRGLLAVAATLLLAGAAWALWPAGQYQPVRPTDRGTLVSFRHVLASPASVARPNAVAAPVSLRPGTHLAVSMIPVGGATKAHPALFVIEGDDGQPAVAILSPTAPDVQDVPTAAEQPTTTTTTATTTSDTTTTTADQPAADAAPAPVAATAFPFKLPDKPGPGGTQALAVGTKDGGVTYDVAYSLVTVKDGANVTNTNSAFAFASCKACTTVAVSFQIVLIVGRSAVIAPINAAGALNVNCPACLTTAIADQLVVTLKSQPSDALVAKLQAALSQLDALPSLGASGSAAAIAATVIAVQQQIETALAESGLLANTTSTSSSTSTRSTTTTTTTASTTTAAATTTNAAETPAPTTSTTAAQTTSSTPTTTAAATTTTTTAETTATTTPRSTTTTTTAATPAPATTTAPASTTTTATTTTSATPATPVAETTSGG